MSLHDSPRRGRPLPHSQRCQRAPVVTSAPVAGDDNAPLSWAMRRSHAAGRPLHVETGRSRVLRGVYAVTGTALVWLALYGLAALLFGETGRAVVLYLLTVVVLVSLGGFGFVLLGASLGVEDRDGR